MPNLSPKVSVIIPSFNRDYCIGKAIESVLSQTWNDYEILVVDDGSNDDTKNVVNCFGSKVRYIYQENAGVSAARNNGINNSLGEWIAFLDSDDEWHENKLAVQIKFIVNHPEVIAHATNVNFIHGGVSKTLFDIRGKNSLGIEKCVFERPILLAINIMFMTSSFMIKKKSLIDAGLFNEKLSLHEDTDLYMRVALCGAFGVSNDALVNMYMRGANDNLSFQHTDNEKNTPEIMSKVFSNILKNKNMNNSERNSIKKLLAAQNFNLSIIIFKNDGFAKAFEYIKASILISPSAKNIVKALALLFFGPKLYRNITKLFNFKRNSFRRSMQDNE